ncbi:MAG: VapE domain-containing protein, partial [Bdellovibrionia bacterium]
SPLKDYRLDWNLQALGDDRNYHGINRNFIILFDEMMGCNKTDIETLKHFITAERLSARKLYTNQVDTLAQNCSCLGTSNKHLDVLIRDETGMRRFVEIKSKEKMDWVLLNSIEPLSIWSAIDETNDDGYLFEVADLLKQEQESYRFQDSVESYLNETNAFNGKRILKVSNEKVFADYVDWCRAAEERPLSKQYFGKRLKSLGFEQDRAANERSYNYGEDFVLWGQRHASKIREDLFDDADKMLVPKS